MLTPDKSQLQFQDYYVPFNDRIYASEVDGDPMLDLTQVSQMHNQQNSHPFNTLHAERKAPDMRIRKISQQSSGDRFIPRSDTRETAQWQGQLKETQVT